MYTVEKHGLTTNPQARSYPLTYLEGVCVQELRRVVLRARDQQCPVLVEAKAVDVLRVDLFKCMFKGGENTGNTGSSRKLSDAGAWGGRGDVDGSLGASSWRTFVPRVWRVTSAFLLRPATVALLPLPTPPPLTLLPHGTPR